jgi:ribosomal small subunit protein bTHX
MGKGDRRTKRGKIWHKSYGKYRDARNKNAETPQAEKQAK